MPVKVSYATKARHIFPPTTAANGRYQGDFVAFSQLVAVLLVLFVYRYDQLSDIRDETRMEPQHLDR